MKFEEIKTELRRIKKDLNMDWFILQDENKVDKSKNAFAIFITDYNYRKYIGEVGALIELTKTAIKITKKEFTQLLKNNSGDIITYLENLDIDANINLYNINLDNVIKDNNAISIKYGNKNEPESHYGDIIITQTTINKIKDFDESKEYIN